jgi:hypothetical protein
MEKIIAAFRVRLSCWVATSHRRQDFVAACPSIDIRRIENARQFYDFVCALEAASPQPPICVTSPPASWHSHLRISKAQPSQPWRRARDAISAIASVFFPAPMTSGRF